MDWSVAFARSPLVAIRRGITPDAAMTVVGALLDEGFTRVEVPLNAPNAMDSLNRPGSRFAKDAVIGAGTVLTPIQVCQIKAAGGRLVVSPNYDARVASAVLQHGIVDGPGVRTESEASAALKAGTTSLKLFSAKMFQAAVVKSLRFVLPALSVLLPVGSIAPVAMVAYAEAGATGFELGSALCRPSMTPAEAGADAHTFYLAWSSLQKETQDAT